MTISILDRLAQRDIADGTLEKISAWRMSLALAAGRVAAAEALLRTDPGNREHVLELAAAAGAEAYCRHWLDDHRKG
jgi:hypothetical protein